MRLPFFRRGARSASDRKVHRLPRPVRRQGDNPYFNRRVQRRMARVLPIAAGAAVPVILLACAILGLTLPGLHLGQINVAGHEHVSREEIDRVIHEEYDARAWGIFPRRNYFLFRTEIVRDALTAHPSIATADVSKTFPDRLTVRIEERQTAFQVLTVDTRALVDDEGVAFSVFPGEGGGRPPSLPPPSAATGTPLLFTTSSWKLPDLVRIVRERATSTYLTLYDTSEAAYVAGEVIVPASIREAILRTKGLLEEVGGGLTAGGAIYDRERRHEVHVITSERWRVLIDPGFSLEAPLEALRAVLTDRIGDRTTLEYVDVRYQDRVYYK